ncbi:hypothetical protein KM043_014307 [Ampulex compressa]|nr:hypothetical protein KM043_014307 [Ampulex compressa]
MQSAPLKAGEREFAVASKRQKLEPSTPSSSGGTGKVNADRRFYAETTAEILRIAIVPKDYPERKWRVSEASVVKDRPIIDWMTVP